MCGGWKWRQNAGHLLLYWDLYLPLQQTPRALGMLCLWQSIWLRGPRECRQRCFHCVPEMESARHAGRQARPPHMGVRAHTLTPLTPKWLPVHPEDFYGKMFYYSHLAKVNWSHVCMAVVLYTGCTLESSGLIVFLTCWSLTSSHLSKVLT